VIRRKLPAVAAVLIALAVGTTAASATNDQSGSQTAAHSAKKKKKKCKKKKSKKKCKRKAAPGAATPPPDTTTPVPPKSFSAPPLDPTIATSMADSAAFLYTGPDAVQTGVDPDTIDDQRVAVLRGRVLDRSGSPLGGVKVAILDHPELGSTQTRDDGLYDIAVNGGGPLTITYEKSGLLPIERRMDVPWQDYVVVNDVAMIPRDNAATTIQSNGADLQVARSSVSTDQQGSRRTTLIFKPGTTGQTVLENGSTQALPGPWTVRATEYTVGDIGHIAMPAELPPTSGYTFAVELSIDQADAAGAVRTDFNNPVSVYVDNFIHAPVGANMPSGFHHEDGDGRWTADPDGRVMKLVGVTGGMADLDIDGNDSGAPESPVELAALGIDAAERTELATLYSQGDEFWRVQTTHFSELDHNYGDGPPPGADPPPNSSPPPPADPSFTCGSIVSCEDQTLRERLPVNGTPFSLYYASDRVPGRSAEDETDVRVTGATIPSGLKGIVVQASVAGHYFERRWADPAYGEPPDQTYTPDLHYKIPWDGTDVYGRPVQGKVPILIRTSYVYVPTRYRNETESTKNFSTFGVPGGSFPAFLGCITVIVNGYIDNGASSPYCGAAIVRNEQRGVGAWDARGIDGLGGWSLDVHHAYDPNEHTVHRGDGLEEPSDLQPAVSTLTAGTPGNVDFPAANGGPALNANIDQVTDVATGPDGSVYILSFPTGGPASGGLRRVDRDGTITELADSAEIGLYIFGGSITVDENGRVYVAGQDPSDTSRGKVVRVDPDGTVTPVAGSNWSGTPAPNDLGDDGPATAAKLMSISDVAMGTDGSLYIADDGLLGFPLLARVRKVDPSTGLITSVAGGGSDASATEDLGNGEPSSEHSMEGVSAIAFGPDGTMYAAMAYADTVVQVGTDGRLTRFAGTGNEDTPSEGFPPLDSDLKNPNDLAVSRDGTVYIRSQHNGPSPSELILAVADGRVTIAGGQVSGSISPVDGAPATRTAFRGDHGMALAPDGTIYAHDHRFLVRRIAPRFAGFGADEEVTTSRDGSELWVFDGDGRHKRTLDPVTGTTLYTFSYDSAGRLVGVTDRDNRTTTVERTSDGRASAIVAPGGARTELDVNGAGYATQIRDSRGAATNLTYDSGGLLTKLVDRRGGVHDFTYDGDGRLTDDGGPAGHSLHFARDEQVDQSTVTKTTGEGRQTTYVTERKANGSIEQTRTDPSGAVTKLVRQPDGTRVLTDPNGTQTTVEYEPDPRFGMRAPVVSKEVTETPGGRTTTRTFSRSADLADPADPFSFTTLTDSFTRDGHTSTRTYTKATRQLQWISSGGRKVTAVLDSKDRVTSDTYGTGRTPLNITYNAQGHPTNVDRGSEHGVLTWDGRDRLTSYADGAGGDRAFGYDGGDRTTSVTDGEGGVAQLSYDGEGDPTGVSEPSGRAHGLGHDGYGLLTSYTPPAGGAQQTRTRDDEGLISSINQGAGHAYTVSRDSGGRTSGLSASGNDDSQFTYVGNSQRPGSADTNRPGAPDDQTLGLEWDGGDVTKSTYGGGSDAAAGTITLTYDGRGNLTDRKIQSSPDADINDNLTYDDDDLRLTDGPYAFTRDGALGEVTQVAAGSDGSLLDADTAYDGFGRRTTVSGTVGGSAVFSQTHTYDDGGRLATRDEDVAGTSADRTYTYDDAGRLTGVDNGDDDESYAYDADGNRTSRSGPATGGSTESATYDSQGRLDTRGGIDYTFDNAGYLTQRGGDTFNYGPQGRLLSATVGGNAITYDYDGLGRRTSRTDAGGTERYLYGSPQDPWELTASRSPAGVLTQYFYDPSGNLIGLERGGSRYYVFSDDLGSPRLVTTDTGTAVKRIDYDAFGDVTTDTNTAFPLAVGFAGGLKDPTSGLILFGLRDYEPASGRWTSRDPQLFGGRQANLYAYVGNDPVNVLDPSGTLPEWAEKFVDKILSKTKYKDFVDAKDKLKETAQTLQEGADQGQVDTSGFAELETGLKLLDQNFPILNWVAPPQLFLGAVDAAKIAGDKAKLGNLSLERKCEEALSLGEH
jgi:RHS repeat-associated protein